jgi:hypothetical protein
MVCGPVSSPRIWIQQLAFATDHADTLLAISSGKPSVFQGILCGSDIGFPSTLSMADNSHQAIPEVTTS